MPTYKNTTKKKLYTSKGYVKPDETIETTVYENMDGLVLQDHFPFVKRFVLLSKTYTLTGNSEELISIPCPSQMDNYMLNIETVDEVLLFLDLDPNAIGIKIKGTYQNVLNWRERAFIKIKNTGSANVTVNFVAMTQ